MKLRGRILVLAEDPAVLNEHLQGASLDPHQTPLKYGVNTDAMISGQACTLGYSPEVLGPWFLNNFLDVVSQDQIRSGGFQVAVGGDAYGSGSSREVAVVAHQGAGIELVVARNFQRIFQENMVYAGMPFTTDFKVLDRLQRGESIDTKEFTEALPDFFRAVAEHGGLLRYGSALLDGMVQPSYTVDRKKRALNAVEKVIAQNVWRGPNAGLGIDDLQPGDQVLCRAGFRGVHEYTGGMVMALFREEWGDAPVEAPELAAAFEDHFVLIDQPTVPDRVKQARLGAAKRLAAEMVEACERQGIRIHGPGREFPAGVCHRLVVEDYALPGMIIALTDSHSPTAGVMNAFAFGVGSTAMSFALRTGLIPVTVPRVVRVWVEGKPSGGLTPKDLILHLIGDPYFREEQWRETPTDTCVVQFGGPGLDHWNVDELSVLTNMTVEGGLMTGMVEPCEPLAEFLRTQRDIDAEAEGLFVHPDEGASYARTITINLDQVPLTIATPGDSRNRLALEAAGKVPIHNVVIASCTGGSLADLRAAAAVLEGHQLAPKVRVTVTPSSSAVAEQAEAEGLLATFRDLGCVVTDPGCGSCIGNGPGIPFEGETTASTTNRNFARRMGAPGPVYLVSPAVAAASAITGQLSDPRTLS